MSRRASTECINHHIGIFSSTGRQRRGIVQVDSAVYFNRINNAWQAFEEPQSEFANQNSVLSATNGRPHAAPACYLPIHSKG